MIEALATGTPVAGLPVPGPLDVIGANGRGRLGRPVGAVDRDLGAAIARALTVRREDCAAEARTHDWRTCTDQFLDGLSLREELRLAA